MPRNASGVYSLPESAFVAGTTIESDPMNNNLSDIGTALTQSLAVTGVTTMTGPIKAAAGSVTAPSITFGSAQGTGFFLSGTDEISWTANGVLKGVFGADGAVELDSLTLAGDLSVAGTAGITGDLGVGGDVGVTGQVYVGDGSASNPGHSFLNGTGVGFYLAGTNVLGIAAASVNVGTIRASGSVALVGNVSVSGNAEIYGTLVVLGSVSVSDIGAIKAIIEDNKTLGTAAQSLTAATDNVRELNTLVFNRGTSVTLASNRFTLPAGTWEIEWMAPINESGSNGGSHQSFLYNQSDATEVKRGTGSAWDLGSDTVTTGKNSEGSTVVTIAASKAFEIRHRPSATTPGGDAISLGTEVYTRVVVRKA